MQKQYMKLLLIILMNSAAHGATQWQIPDPQLRLDQASFLGAHNSLMAREDGWIYAQQKWTLTKLLDAGVRSFEIDLATMPDDKGGVKNNLFVCHGICSLGGKVQKVGKFATFISKMPIFTDWLKKNPNEIIILQLDIGRDKAIKPNQFDTNIDMLSQDQKDLILTPADWLPEDHDGVWPTLDWMVKNNKRIVIFNLKDNDSPKYTYNHTQYINSSGSSPRKDNYTKLTSKSQAADDANQGKIKRMFQLSQTNFLSEQYALEGYNLYRKADLAKNKANKALTDLGTKLNLTSKQASAQADKDLKQAQAEVDKLLEKIPPSDYKTLARIVQDCKDANLLGGKNPNILQIDWIDQFIPTDGMKMINQWNDEASKNLSPASDKDREL